jgi:tetratricopeptide (TPR) repeat protein
LAWRPLEESIDSLRRLNWWSEPDRIQRTLWNATETFLQGREHLRIEYDAVLLDPANEARRMIEFLQITPTREQVTQAINMVKRPTKARVDEAGASRKSIPGGAWNEKCSNEKIVATMLSGNSQDLVTEAVESVYDWVDEIVLIDTGISDQTAERVRASAKDKFVSIEFPWRNDFAAARNTAMQIAQSRGASWALTVDTDERIDLSAYKNREHLMKAFRENTAVTTWMVASRDGSYTKERFIRLPTNLKWSGRTHEALVGATAEQRMLLPNSCFWETPKSPEAMERKLNRDLEILLEVTRDDPANARWWYYLGQTFEALKQNEEALQAFLKCAKLDGWGEQAAWAAYCAAKCYVHLKQFKEAEEIAAYGLSRDATFPELAWIAGWCAFSRGDHHSAIAWSRMASSIGFLNGDEIHNKRVGLRHLPAWYEAPFDVLRFALRRAGKETEALAAERDFQVAKERRNQFGSRAEIQVT